MKQNPTDSQVQNKTNEPEQVVTLAQNNLPGRLQIPESQYREYISKVFKKEGIDTLITLPGGDKTAVAGPVQSPMGKMIFYGESDVRIIQLTDKNGMVHELFFNKDGGLKAAQSFSLQDIKSKDPQFDGDTVRPGGPAPHKYSGPPWRDVAGWLGAQDRYR